ncbi:MAG: PorT family protein [Bacteroidetes bacterium]|nr:PorT family protein [Bacteroidota bacterium]
MKKITLTFLIFLLAFSFTYAQEKQKKQKQNKNLPTPLIEVMGGMGLSSVAGSLSSTEKRLTGLFGAGATIPVSAQNNIHVELAYTFQGFKYKLPKTYVVDTVTIDLKSAEQRFNYVKLNVMDKYFIDKKRTFYVNGGFYLAYLSQARFQVSWDTKDEKLEELDEGNESDFKTFDFGLNAGVGVRLGNKQASNFTIEARLSYGLINVAKPAADGRTFNEHNIYGILKFGVDIPVWE